jgi:hypothetical protein
MSFVIIDSFRQYQTLIPIFISITATGKIIYEGQWMHDSPVAP